MHVLSHKLAEFLVDRINERVPAPFVLRADNGRVHVHAGDELWFVSHGLSIVDEDDGRTLGQRLETAVRALLNSVQDVVMRHFHIQWPTDSSGSLAVAGARMTGDFVDLWYGPSEERAVIRFRQIPLKQVTS